MRLITAIAALALVAGSMDVEAQKRGKVGLPGDSDDHAPQIAPVAHLAIRTFGVLDPEERKNLAEAVEEGDEEASEELQTDGIEAIEAMIEALKDEDARKIIKLGMMITTFSHNVPGGSQSTHAVPRGEADLPFALTGGDGAANLDKMLDGVGEQLEAQLTSFVVGKKIQIIK